MFVAVLNIDKLDKIKADLCNFNTLQDATSPSEPFQTYAILPWGPTQGVIISAFGQYASLRYGCEEDIQLIMKVDDGDTHTDVAPFAKELLC